jgi:serine protease Do
MLQRVFTGLVALGLAVLPAFVSAADAPRPFLGVMVGPTQAEKDQSPTIHRLDENGPAARAGLQKGDLILKVGAADVKTAEDLIREVAKAKPGDPLPILVKRNGKQETFTVTVGERPKESPPVELKQFSMLRKGVLGVWTEPVTPALKEKLGLAADKGALVVNVSAGSSAAKAGLAKDDIITAVNDQPITNSQELRSALQKIGAGHDLTLKVMRGKETKEIKAHLEATHFGFLPEFPQFKDEENVQIPPAIQAELQKRLEQMEKQFGEMFEETEVAPGK